MKTNNQIDDLFSKAMTDYKAEPSLGLWLRIERHFFPPSKFRPSGLITSVLLLIVAGLMPWLLIPANNGEEKAPTLPEGGNYHRGYLIQSATPAEIRSSGSKGSRLATNAFSIKPTVYLAKTENPAVADPGSQLLASIADPAEDPAIQPLLQAYKDEYRLKNTPEAAPAAYSAIHWIYRMRSYSAANLYAQPYSENVLSRDSELPTSSFTPNYENDYFRMKKGEYSVGLNFNPSIIFYDPNPYNKILGGEAVFHYKISSFNIMAGLGFSRVADVGSYQVNYVTNDSVGYYLRVVSFIPDPRRPGEITYIVVREALYDSVPHYVIEDKTNHYSYLDIPLSFGYTFLQKNRVTLTANIGVKFSILLASDEPQADFYISDAEMIDIERQVPPRTSTNWRFTAGVDFGYLFARKFSLHLEPVFEQYISPIYVEQAGYAPKKPYITGVKAGIRYNF
jgi:hypothetical protein